MFHSAVFVISVLATTLLDAASIHHRGHYGKDHKTNGARTQFAFFYRPDPGPDTGPDDSTNGGGFFFVSRNRRAPVSVPEMSSRSTEEEILKSTEETTPKSAEKRIPRSAGPAAFFWIPPDPHNPPKDDDDDDEKPTVGVFFKSKRSVNGPIPGAGFFYYPEGGLMSAHEVKRASNEETVDIPTQEESATPEDGQQKDRSGIFFASNCGVLENLTERRVCCIQTRIHHVETWRRLVEEGICVERR